MALTRVDPDTGAPTQVTDGPAVDSEPAWSPDRSKIAFASNRDGNVEIYVMDADGSDVTRLTRHKAQDTSPYQNWDIYTMDADDGGNLSRLTTSSYADKFPSWSPDGSEIAAPRSLPRGVLSSDANFDIPERVLEAAAN